MPETCKASHGWRSFLVLGASGALALGTLWFVLPRDPDAPAALGHSRPEVAPSDSSAPRPASPAPAAAPSATAVRSLLRSERPELRQEACRLIGTTASPEVIRAAVEFAASNGDAMTRCEVILAVKRSLHPEAGPALARLFNTRADDQTRRWILAAFRQYRAPRDAESLTRMNNACADRAWREEIRKVVYREPRDLDPTEEASE